MRFAENDHMVQTFSSDRSALSRRRQGVTESYLGRLLRPTFLAPDITEAISIQVQEVRKTRNFRSLLWHLEFGHLHCGSLGRSIRSGLMWLA